MKRNLIRLSIGMLTVLGSALGLGGNSRPVSPSGNGRNGRSLTVLRG